MPKTIIAILLFSLVYVPVCRSDEVVLELTETNFEETIKQYDIVLVKFYAEWCGHCKKIAPEFAAASKILKSNDPPVQLVSVNCPNTGGLCEKYQVSGYPTLKIFRTNNGELVSEDYSGGRDAAEMVKYMKSRAGPASKLLKTESEIEGLRKGEDSVIVAFVNDETSEEYKDFLFVANSLRDHFKFAHIKSADKQFIIRYLPQRVQTKMEEEFVQLNLPSTRDIINFWVSENWGGLLAWNRGDGSLFDNEKDPWVTISFELDYTLDPKGTNYIRNRLLKAIKELRKDGSKVKFSMTSASKNSHLLESNFNIQYTKETGPVVTVLHKKQKYVMSEKFSYLALKKFVKDFESGRVQPYLKSELKPESQPDAVVKVVGTTFDEVVRNKDTSVLIEFFAPWCGHCKTLKPVYEELAQKLKGESDIVIAAMDATANDVPTDFGVSGFPTLFWVSKTDNKIIPYDGARELDGFLTFINDNVGRKVGEAKDEL